MDHQVWIAFSNVMLLVFQLNHFLAFISDLGESKPNLHSAVIHVLGKSRTQRLVNIFSNFSNYGLVAHSRLKPRGQRRSISFMISSAQRIASAMAQIVAGTFTPPSSISERSTRGCGSPF